MKDEYTTLYENDNDTAKVRMTVNGHDLEQDIALGADRTEFEDNVKYAMAVFKHEIAPTEVVETFKPAINTPVVVDVLPELPPEDFLPAEEPINDPQQGGEDGNNILG